MRQDLLIYEQNKNEKKKKDHGMNKLFWTSQKIKRVGERRKIEHIDEFICHQCINDKTIQTGTCIFHLGSKNLLRTAQMYIYMKSCSAPRLLKSWHRQFVSIVASMQNDAKQQSQPNR